MQVFNLIETPQLLNAALAARAAHPSGFSAHRASDSLGRLVVMISEEDFCA